MTEKEILTQSIADHQKAIDTAKEKLAATEEPTYSTGDRFRYARPSNGISDKAILVCRAYKVALVDLRDGRFYRDLVCVENPTRITPAEFRTLLYNPEDLTRYWDARLKVKS